MDDQPPAALDYALHAASADHLQLIETPEMVRVIFPAPPTWYFSVSLAGMLLWVAQPVILMCAVIYALPKVGSGELTVLAHDAGWGNILVCLVSALIFPFLITREIQNFRRFGHASKVLTVEPQQVTIMWPAGGKMRTRSWPAQSISSVGIKIMTDVFTRRPHYQLQFHKRKWSTLRYPLPTKNPELPHRILMATRAVLVVKPDPATDRYCDSL